MKNYTILLLTFLFPVLLYAQNTSMTPYEKGRKDLADETLVKIFDSFSESDQLSFGLSFLEAIKSTDDIFEQTAIAENFITGLCGVGEMFKTEANYMAASIFESRAYTGNALQSLKAIGDWYKLQRTELEKTKTEYDIQREKERLVQSRGIGLLYKTINKKFTDWAKKGELEKSAVYQDRLRTESIFAFDSICFVSCSEVANENSRILTDGYDVDNEVYNIKWNVVDDKRNVLTSVKASFPLNPNDLEKFYGEIRNRPIKPLVFDVGLQDGYVVPVKAMFCLHYLNCFYTIVTFDNITEVPISSKIITNEDLRSYLDGHIYTSAGFRRNFIIDVEALEVARGLEESMLNAYSDLYPGAGYKLKAPDWEKTGLICSYSVFNEKLKQYKEEYLSKFFSNLITTSALGLTFFLNEDSISDAVWGFDSTALINRISELEKEWIINESKTLTKEQLQKGLDNIPVFVLIMETKRNENRNIYCPVEEMCKLVIENNEYLSSKIRVKNSYYEALDNYYKKHM